MSKELTTSQAQTPAAPPAELLQAGGFGHGVETSDLERGYIILLQSNSNKFLDDPECEGIKGDYIRTDTKAVIGTPKDPLEIIVLDMFKTWRKKKKEDPDKGTSLGSVPFVPGQEVQREGKTDGGDEYVLQLQYNFVVMLPGDLDSLPLIFPLRATSTGAAKMLITKGNLSVKAGKPSWETTYVITHGVDVDGNKKWYFSQAKLGNPTTAEQQKAAADWFKLSQTVHKPKEATQEVVATESAAVVDSDPEFDENNPI